MTFPQRTEVMEWRIQIYKYVEDMSSKQRRKYLQRPYGNTHLECPSKRKMTSMCQEQAEQGGRTENEIRGIKCPKRSSHVSITVMGKPFWESSHVIWLTCGEGFSETRVKGERPNRLVVSQRRSEDSLDKGRGVKVKVQEVVRCEKLW